MGNNKPDGRTAEDVAIQALSFIAGDPVLLPRFVAISGIGPSAMREAAREPGFLTGVLQFILAHEPTLMQFAENAQIEPAAVARACRALPHGDDGFDVAP